MFKRIMLIVLDSVGIGALPDAAAYDDVGAHTIGHIAEQVPALSLPHLQDMGLANIAPITGIAPSDHPRAYYGKMAEASVGKDTMTGHWELMGLRIDIPFRTYPLGFPSELIAQFEQETGRKVIGNKPASGTAILDELGPRQMETGEWIVYTSADSVFQLAAHEEIIPLDELYRACEIARRLTLDEKYMAGRVIARPYVGQPGRFQRTANRRDYAVRPPEPTVMNQLQTAGYDCIAIGKINDIYSGEGVTQSYPSKNNAHGLELTFQVLRESFHGLAFTNLVDFDSLYGHRRDPQGYAHALEHFDQHIPKLTSLIGDQDLLMITADHGNDPTHHGTDHTREYVPLLVYNPGFKNPRSLGVRATFADVGATIAENFGVKGTGRGTSFLSELVL